MADRYVDLLLRASVQTGTPLNPAAQADLSNTRAELGRLLFSTASQGTELASTDRAYIAQVVANRTGLSPAEAASRADSVITQAKTAANEGRKAVAKAALWLAASMLAGALAAALAAVEGGVYRDSRWYEAGWRKGQSRVFVSNSVNSAQ